MIARGRRVARGTRSGPIRRPADLAKAPAVLRKLLHLEMNLRGLYLARRGFMSLSLPMTDADHDTLVAAFEVMVNGSRIEKATALRPGDAVHFGFEDSYHLVFSDSDGRINRILDQISSASSEPTGAVASFARLRALVEMARTLQSSLAVDEVLGAVIDAALRLTHADRGFLLLRPGDELEIKVGRDANG